MKQNVMAVVLSAAMLTGCGGGDGDEVVTSTCSSHSPLREASLTMKGDDLIAKFVTDGSVTDDVRAFYSVMVASSSGDKAKQLGLAFEHGERTSFFVFDAGEAKNQDLSGSTSQEGPHVVANFPASAVTDLGDGWTWTAGLSIDGTDVGFCPRGRSGKTIVFGQES